MSDKGTAGPEAAFRTALEAGHVLLQHCSACETLQFYPSIVCRACTAPVGESRRTNGDGTVYATTEFGDRNLCIVELVEGPRVLATLAPAVLPIGTPVRARVERPEAGPRIVFEARS